MESEDKKTLKEEVSEKNPVSAGMSIKMGPAGQVQIGGVVGMALSQMMRDISTIKTELEELRIKGEKNRKRVKELCLKIKKIQLE